MRRFELHRDEDASGVSGTGKVAQGVQFSDGTCALRWLTARSSTAIYDLVDDIVLIHGHGGRTRLVWLDPLEIQIIFQPGDQTRYAELVTRRQEIIDKLDRPT